MFILYTCIQVTLGLADNCTTQIDCVVVDARERIAFYSCYKKKLLL